MSTAPGTAAPGSTAPAAAPGSTGAPRPVAPGPYDLSRAGLAALLAGEPAYRARQVWDGLHRRALRPEEMTDLPAAAAGPAGRGPAAGALGGGAPGGRRRRHRQVVVGARATAPWWRRSSWPTPTG